MKTLLIIPIILVLSGCASYHIPTPCGMAKINTFLKTIDMPKMNMTTNSFSIEGYVSKGDTEVITASAGAIGAIVGAAVKAAGPLK